MSLLKGDLAYSYVSKIFTEVPYPRVKFDKKHDGNIVEPI